MSQNTDATPTGGEQHDNRPENTETTMSETNTTTDDEQNEYQVAVWVKREFIPRVTADSEQGAEDEAIPKSKLYAAYLEYCRQEGIPSDTQHSMTRGLKEENFQDGRVYVDGDRERSFTGLQWTGRGKELLEDADDRSASNGDGRAGGLDDF